MAVITLALLHKRRPSSDDRFLCLLRVKQSHYFGLLFSPFSNTTMRPGHPSFHLFIMATLITTFILIKSAINGRSQSLLISLGHSVKTCENKQRLASKGHHPNPQSPEIRVVAFRLQSLTACFRTLFHESQHKQLKQQFW